VVREMTQRVTGIVKKQILNAFRESERFSKKHKNCKHPNSHRSDGLTEEGMVETCLKCRSVLGKKK